MVQICTAAREPRKSDTKWMSGAWGAALLLSLALSGCGGSASDSAQPKEEASAQTSSSSSSTAAATDSPLASGAALSGAELAAAEKSAQAADDSGQATPLDELQPGQIVPKSAYTSGDVVRKAAAVRIPVYRFFNGSTGAHFFTTSTAERDNIISKLSPPFSYEGSAFSVASAFSPGLSPVHRFYNTQTGVHFYTISESERASVAANMPQFHYEGIAYHASQVAGQGLIPFYRFYVPGKGFHFYTADESEKASIIANLAAVYSYEGVGYYVLDTNWTAEKLPHTGMTDQQCYRSGGTAVEACSHPETKDLNPQQDGHRTAVNPMSYSQVDGRDLSSCVRDNVTGLIWEGKTDDGGLRDKDNTYTNLGNGAYNDASSYVAAVNASNLCGYSDWRLPTMQELAGIMDFGAPSPGLRVRNAWFPNFVAIWHWSSELYSSDSTKAWLADFNTSSFYAVHWIERTTPLAVRLVRGSWHPQGTRFSYSTVPYGSDAANNVVNDAWTGLQWRRCGEGKTWDGSACTGTATRLGNGEQALQHARQQTGWRLPNIKELYSVVDLTLSSGVSMDPVAFPDRGLGLIWSSTNVSDGYWLTGGGGIVGAGSGDVSARLVRLP